MEIDTEIKIHNVEIILLFLSHPLGSVRSDEMISRGVSINDHHHHKFGIREIITDQTGFHPTDPSRPSLMTVAAGPRCFSHQTMKGKIMLLQTEVRQEGELAT
jgi:hypothetical protein